MEGTEVKTIPYTRKVYYDTYANLPTTGLKAQDFGYATDRKVLYRWSGSAWQPVTIHSSSGLAAAIPIAADLPNGSLYAETDTGLTKQVQSGAWEIITASPIAIATGNYTGDGITSRQITTGFKCSMVVVMSEAASDEVYILVPSKAARIAAAAACNFAWGTLHATDGFVTSAGGAFEMNESTKVYYYWAISE